MKKPLTTKQKFWFDHINSAQSAGVPLSAYAPAHKLSVKALYNFNYPLRFLMAINIMFNLE
jgi:hypothetical protein